MGVTTRAGRKLAPEFEKNSEPNHLTEKEYESDEEESTPNLKSDIGNFVLLVILYLLQGIPMGLSFGSIPFLLKNKLSYADMAIFSLSSYPYSLKLLWSPIVDSVYIKSLGRRKSWILPIQALLGIAFLALGSSIDEMMAADRVPVFAIALIFFVLIFLCATQDIAVDGWALTLLRKENLPYASTAQTIGLNSGYFLSFTIFLALNSAEFCNKYLRSVPQDVGILVLGSYLTFWGLSFLIMDIWLILFKTEEWSSSDVDSDKILKVYRTIADICMKPHMKRFILILMLSKIGWQVNDSVTGLKLLEKGFGKEDLALAVLIDFPFQILFGYYAAKWSSGDQPLKPWLWAFYGRIFFAIFGALIVYCFPDDGVTTTYFAIVIISTVLGSFASTVQFVGMGCFFANISDPLIGGTYMTLLNTLSNLGGTWPRFFVLEAVEYFTISKCTENGESCSSELQKKACAEIGGKCGIVQDGYYIVTVFCILIGITSLFIWIKPQIQQLERLPKSAWRLQKRMR